jgi:hypothetical protein
MATHDRESSESEDPDYFAKLCKVSRKREHTRHEKFLVETLKDSKYIQHIKEEAKEKDIEIHQPEHLELVHHLDEDRLSNFSHRSDEDHFKE